MKSFYTSGNNSDKDLYDKLFFSELGLSEITNNDEVMIQLTEKLEKITQMSVGYNLFTIDIKTQHNIILICKSQSYGANFNFCYIIKEDKNIDTGTSFTLDEEKEIDLYDFIRKQASETVLDEMDIVSLIITKTMLGYRINRSFALDHVETLKNYKSESVIGAIPKNIENLHGNIRKSIINSKNEIRNKFNDLKEQYELPFTSSIDLNDSIITTRSDLGSTNVYSYRHPIVVAKIDKVINVNNKRYAPITMYDGFEGKKLCSAYRIGESSKLYYKSDKARVIQLSNMSHLTSVFAAIDYNYIDTNRYIAILGDGYYYKYLVVFEDPMVKELTIDDIYAEIDNIVDKIVKDRIDTAKCELKINAEGSSSKIINLQLSKYGPGSYYMSYKDMQKAMKSMYNEYNYVIKKNKSEGSDVKITDNLTYYHSNGKLEYSDFSIELSIESVKAKMNEAAKNYMLQYFRKEITEEKIIADLTSMIYSSIDSYLLSTNVSNTFTITFNNNVVVNVDVNKGDAHFTYINNNRVNKNEISSILTEISCYSSQEAADKFIANICKKGLSVFIGLSSGYFYGNKFYKFKTSEKSGEYIMNIDNIDINVKGKKLFNTLFSIAFKNEREHKTRINNNDYINNHVFNSVSTKFDYIKYKIMIDKSYQLFINKSKDFLDKKVNDTASEHVKYIDVNQNKVYQGVKVVGSSGKTYVIAYDLKESYVFMNPTIDTTNVVDDELPIYTGGTYICMIDQSKMKATVGYDTVVSKLLSLKHDSVIASTIYNLEDELNK